MKRNGFTLQAQFSSPAKGITAIYGPSGCGKTTLLRAIAGLEENVTGSIRFGDVDWLHSRLPTHKRNVGYVFQRSHLFSHLDVRKNLLYGTKRADAHKRRIAFDDAVSLLGVEKLIDKSVGILSGGERQRVAIARALLSGPELLLLDEPMAALDHQSKSEILPYLEKLHRTLSIPMLYVSHATDEVARLADFIVLMEDGKTYKHGPLLETVADINSPLAEQTNAFSILEGCCINGNATDVTSHNPANSEKALLTSINVDGNIFRIPFAALSGQDSVRLRIIAKDVSICLDRPLRTSILNVLETTIVDIKDNASKGQSVVKLTLGSQFLLARISLYSKQHLLLAVGDKVFAQIKAVALVR
ncbi:molybdenum ABC transporter ATP-binding protein [Gammaproteobacteria bacterium 42_54_T18]|nr:molybdenum ABC transporter ATP-binding protein [Gammaproteobacteria bacterium 42_54_T18]